MLGGDNAVEDHTYLAMLTVRERRRELSKTAFGKITFAEAVFAQICVLAVMFVFALAAFVLVILRCYSASAIHLIAIGAVGATLSILTAACARALLVDMLSAAHFSEKKLLRNIRGAFFFILLKSAVLLSFGAIAFEISSTDLPRAFAPVVTAVAALSAALWYQSFFAAEYIFENHNVSPFRAIARSFAVTRGRRTELLLLRISAVLRSLSVVASLGAVGGSYAIGEIRLTAEYSRYLIALHSALKESAEAKTKAAINEK